MMHARRSLAVLLSAAGASVSAGAGYLYLGEEPQADAHSKALPQHPSTPTNNNIPLPESESTTTTSSPPRRRRPLRAVSKKELGWEQSLARDLACWISSASVYTATQMFYAAAPSATELLKRVPAPPLLHEELLNNGRDVVDATSQPTKKRRTMGLYHSLVGWMQELNPQASDWNADRVIQSASFSMLLNLVSGVGNLSLREDLEQDMYRAVGLLATNAQCAHAIVQRATRYGKHALLNMAQAHDVDPRMGEALRRMVIEDDKTQKEKCFGPANVMSLVALVLADDIPDEYLQFALWALSKAASPESLSNAYEWRKTLFGDDAAAKTRRKLIGNDKLWHALAKVKTRPLDVQIQAGRLLSELSEEPNALVYKIKRHLGTLDTVVDWISAHEPVLACAALRTVGNIASDRGIRDQLVAMEALEKIRGRVLRLEAKADPRLTVHLLRAVRSLAQPLKTGELYVLDRDALSFMRDSDDDHPVYADDIVNPNAMLKNQYVDGWIELFTTFLRSDHDEIRAEAAQCLEQLTTFGSHQDQGIQEWLIAVLDGVLQQVPQSIATNSTSVRAARSRTRPIQGRQADSNAYASSHARALHALAFVAGRKECQAEFARRGGVPLLKTLLNSQSVEVQREAARVLANLFTCDDMDAEIADFARWDGQLTRSLDEWTRSSDMMLRSLAHRARSNRRYQHNRLQHADESDVKYLDGVHPLHFSTSPTFNSGNDNQDGEDDESSTDYDLDVVFIHGLLGCPYETWVCGDDETTVWGQKWLLDDLKRDGHNPRLLSIGYDSQLLASESTWRTMCFEETSREVLKKLQAARVGSSGRPVMFVTHSLGGVVLKQVLLESTKVPAQSDGGDENKHTGLVDYVNGVIFYGVPHHGSPVAQTIQVFRPRTLGIEQHPVTEHLHGTPHLKMLNDWCASLFEEKSIPAISISETVPCRLPLIGVDALVVPPTSANPGFGEFVLVENATHVDVCKPYSQNDMRYVLAKEFIAKHAPASDMMNVD